MDAVALSKWKLVDVNTEGMGTSCDVWDVVVPRNRVGYALVRKRNYIAGDAMASAVNFEPCTNTRS